MHQAIIDGKEIDVPAEYTLLKAWKPQAPRFYASAITSGCRSPAIAGCDSSK